MNCMLSSWSNNVRARVVSRIIDTLPTPNHHLFSLASFRLYIKKKRPILIVQENANQMKTKNQSTRTVEEISKTTSLKRNRHLHVEVKVSVSISRLKISSLGGGSGTNNTNDKECVDLMKNCARNKKFCHHPSYVSSERDYHLNTLSNISIHSFPFSVP